MLTRDHTVASEHASLGLLSAQEAAEAETRHLLSRSLGSGMFVSVDVDEHQVLPAIFCCFAPTACTAPLASAEIAAIVGAGRGSASRSAEAGGACQRAGRQG